MTTFFRSFWGSSWPKQLLRYALRRFDMLDNETLDLENLDFALGRNTVLEFRDVGIILQKLEKLLKLPATFSIQKAKVLLLRITIPVDIHFSPITVEVEGVDVRLRVAPKDEKDGQKRKRRKGKENEEEVVPTASDLAQSFLATQPLAEKKQLEDALAAEAQDMGASMFSDTDSEDESNFGTGQPLSLPGFLTDFLHGIVDRVQVRINSVTFQMDMEVPVDLCASSAELVTFQIALDNVSVEGVTTPGVDSDETAKIVHKEGKRHISLGNVRAFLISEANVISTLARSSSMPSSETSQTESQSPVLSEVYPLPRQPTVSEVPSSSDPMADSDELERSRYPLQDSEDAFNIPYELDDAADERGAQEPTSSLSTPRASIHQDFGSPRLEPGAHSEIAEPEPAPWTSFDQRGVQSEPFLPRQELFGAAPRTPSPSPSSHSGSGSSGSRHSTSEDLTQSRLYSHEDAESMYMSAFSQAQSQDLQATPAMPGAWDVSPETSPIARHVGFSGEGTEREAKSPAVVSPTRAASSAVDLPSGSSEGNSGGGHGEPDTQQEDAATPRGSTRLVKEILSLQSISMYLPSHHTPEMVVASDLGKSVSPQLPGAFSVHSAAPRSPGLAPVSLGSPAQPLDKSIEVNFGPLKIRFDASIGFLLINVVSKLLEALQGQPDSKATISDSKTSTSPKISVSLEDLSVLFLEKLAGVADTPQRLFSIEKVGSDSDVLLRANLQNASGSVQQAGTQTTATASIERFTFGYANDDIIFFDKEIKMFESVMNTFPKAGEDISIHILSTPENTRCKVNTLPLHVKLDLQKLDETFSWFGGLSSFLNMGSSMTSNASKGPKSPVKTSHKPRGVRFDTPVHADDRSAAKENKIDLRVNGFHLDLIGRECSVALDTSALKLVSREEAVAVHFSRIHLEGPRLRNSRANPPLILDILDTRLEYLTAPRAADLDRVLELVTPSKVKFDENEDEIIVDRLLAQRKKGAVLRLSVDKIQIHLANFAQLNCLPTLGEELARLGTVAKYLPEDDRPGLLTLALVKNIVCNVDVGGRFGEIEASVNDLELAHITVPSLIAVAVGGISVNRNKIEQLVSSPGVAAPGTLTKPPVLMMRMLDDIEPVLKVKLIGIEIDYRVPTVMDILGLAEDTTPQEYEASLSASVANLGDRAQMAIQGAQTHTTPTDLKNKPIKVDLVFRDCLIGLNPLALTSKLLFVLTDAQLEATPGKNDTVSAAVSLRKASILLIDDVSVLGADHSPSSSRQRVSPASSPQVVQLCATGYVDICQISSAKASVKVNRNELGEQIVNIEIRDDLLVLETCADSTQTLLHLASALTPPTPPSKEIKYRTQVVPVQDLLASITADAFGKAEGEYDFDNDFAMAQELGGSADNSEGDFYGVGSSGGDSGQLNLDSHYYEEAAVQEQLFDATASSVFSGTTTAQDTNDGVLLTNMSTADLSDMESGSDDLVIQDNYFGTESTIQGKAHKWNSAKNIYDRSNDAKVQKSPLKLCVRDVHVIWNLFDGYDWERTRGVISKAVQDIEAKAHERRARTDRRAAFEQELEEENPIIEDCLFNSIYIGIPGNRDPAELTQAINQELNDNATETGSIATSAFTNTTIRAGSHGHRSRPKKLKLGRSRHHKITFELKGVNVDLVTFPEDSGETMNSIDIRVHDLDVFDHIPTSTWKKFAMYDQDAGEREMGASMVHLELLNTKPVAAMPATEMVLKVTVLPLRLHVDQDALDFITRFFGFKDADSAPVHTSPSDVPFIQRAEVNDIPVKLDFKPKRVDYAGLRSGRTTEFMNFVILEDARLVLRHIILYGVSGFDRLGDELNDIWTANVKATQLPGILAGLAPVRSLVNAGSGFKELVEIPIREYRKDGRIVRSIGKGAVAFAKTTGTEVVKLGAKLAIGTQYALQGAEGMLAPQGPGGETSTDWTGEDEDGSDDTAFPEERKQISLYADQPMGIVQGVRGAYTSLARDLSVARDAIIAVPGEVMESTSAHGVAKAVLKRAPTIIFRPAIGATKAIGQTLLGATNALDPENRRRMDAKYKRH